GLQQRYADPKDARIERPRRNAMRRLANHQFIRIEDHQVARPQNLARQSAHQRPRNFRYPNNIAEPLAQLQHIQGQTIFVAVVQIANDAEVLERFQEAFDRGAVQPRLGAEPSDRVAAAGAGVERAQHLDAAFQALDATIFG